MGRPEDGDVTLRVSVVSTDAAHPGTAVLPDLTIAAGAFLQVGRVLASSGLEASAGWALVERVAGDAGYGAYAVLNDAVSGDGAVVPAEERSYPHSFSFELVVPVLTETDSYTTELVLTNASDLETSVGISFPPRWTETTLRVPARGQLAFPAFARELCPSPGFCVGPLTLSVQGSLFATALTTATRGPGRFGLGIQGVPVPQRPLGGISWLDGLRQDEGHRTNLGFSNYGESSEARYRVEVFDGDTGRLAATIPGVVVSAGWIQLSSLLREYAPGVVNAYARLTTSVFSSQCAVYAVVNDGAAPGLGTGDGTFQPTVYVRQ